MTPARLRSLGPLPHEIVGLAFVVAGIVVLERLPVHYPRSAIALAFAGWLPAILGGSALVVAAVHFARRARGLPLEIPLRDEALFFARTVPLVAIVMSVHFLLKSFIWLVHPVTFDRQLLALDQEVHLGLAPGPFLTGLVRSPALLGGLDLFYSAFYYVLVLCSVALLLSLSTLRRRLAFVTAFVSLWAAGAVLYLALPSWGPVFVTPDDFEETLQHMPGTVAVQSALFQELSSLVRDPLAPRVTRFGSVAAFPSLHVAAVTLFALASRPISRRWFRLNVLFVMVMVLGAVITGYHYLLDAWAGMALAALAWVFALRCHPEPKAADALAGADAP